MNTWRTAALAVIALAGVGAAAVGRAAPREAPYARGMQARTQSAPTEPEVIALGDSVFKGRAGGGTCFTCHQPTAKGIPGLAPDLTDDKWIHGDGSYTFIVTTIQKGVPKPKQAAAPMLPLGGAKLTDAQVRAVAAYVYSLRKGGK